MTSPADCGGPYALDPILLRKLVEGEIARTISENKNAKAAPDGALAAFADAALLPVLRAIRADIDAGTEGGDILSHVLTLLDITAALTAAAMIGGPEHKIGALQQMCALMENCGSRRVGALVAAHSLDVESVN